MKIKKIFAVLLAVCMIMSIAVVSAFSENERSEIIITDPYQNINWNEINQYKAALHTHTNQSDGDPTIKQSVERHVEAGFDIVATTDHGTTSYSWIENKENKLIYGALSLVGKSEGELVPLGTSGEFSLKDKTTKEISTVTYTVETSESGDELLKVSNGRTVMRVPFGIENNAVSANAHVNSFFVDYHNNFVTVYDDALKGVEKLNGVSVINHPGEYSKARYELYSKDAYNTDNSTYKYIVNKFANYLEKYKTCIGIDINSKGDGRTRFDRILWDKLLERFSANGENVYSICSSDAHQLNKIDTGFTYILMGELNSSNMKKAMENGEMIGASHCNGNPDELKDIADAVKEYYGETDFYNGIKAAYEIMDNNVAQIESGEKDADDDIGYEYEFCIDGKDDGRFVGETEPKITAITVSGSTIEINSSDALIIRWISNGKQFAATKADESSIDLGNYGNIGNYVRAEVIGEGGILYTEPFLINAQANAGKSNPVDKGFIDFGFIDCLFPMIKNWKDIISRKIG